MAAKMSERERERLGGELYALRGPALAVARRVLGDDSRAEEACAESYLRAVARIDTLPSLRELKPWFLRVVVNTARSQAGSEAARRRREEKAMQEKHTESPAERATKNEMAELASREMAALDEKQRLALSLHYEAGLTHAEVAEALGVPPGTASSDISRGLERLRERLTARGLTVAPAAVAGALGALGNAEAPAALSATLKGIIAGGLGVKSAAVSAAAGAGGAALAWKLAAGLAAATAIGLGTWGGVRFAEPEPPKPLAKKPAAAPKKSGGALAKPVTLQVEKGRFKDVLRDIHKQTGLKWASPPMRLMPSKPISIDVRKAPAREVLDTVARQAGLTWKEGPDGIALFNATAPDFAERLAAFKAAAGKDEISRAEAVNTLGRVGDLRILPHLARALADESALVRGWAAQALKQYLVTPPRVDNWRKPLGSDGRAYNLARYWMTAKEREALVAALLKDGVFSKAMVKQHGRDTCPGEEIRLQFLASLDDDPRARKAVLDALDSDKKSVLSMAVSAAAVSARGDYLGKLLAMGEGNDKSRAVLAARVLRRFPNEKAQKCWLEVSLTKVIAINHIANSITAEDAWAVDRLLKALEEGNPRIKGEALGSLRKLAGGERDAEISKALAGLYNSAKGKKNAKGRTDTALLAALAAYGRPEGREALLHGLANPVHGLDLCMKLGAVAKWPRPDEKLEAAVLKLARSKDPKYSVVRRNARLALPAIGGKKTVAYFRKLALARHEVPKMVRMPPPPRNEVSMWGHAGYQAVKALRKMKSKEAKAALAEIAGKTGDQLLKTQLRLDNVANLPPKQAAAELLKLAEVAAELDPKTLQVPHRIVYWATRRVAQLGGAEAAAALRKMAASRHPAARRWAAAGMGAHPGGAFKAELLKLAADEDEEVFRAACGALLPARGGREGWTFFFASRGAADRRLWENMLETVNGWRGFSLLTKGTEEHFDKLVKMADAAGTEGKVARKVLGAMGTPRAISWQIQELKSAAPERRRAAHSSLRWLYAFDPRVLPALEAHGKAHPEDLKRPTTRPRPRPQPRPEPEVF